MGDGSWVHCLDNFGIGAYVTNQPPKPTQSPTLSGMGNEYQFQGAVEVICSWEGNRPCDRLRGISTWLNDLRKGDQPIPPISI